MRFKKFLLDNYCLCEEGKKLKKFFINLQSIFEQRESSPDFYRTVNSWLDAPLAEEVYSDSFSVDELTERPQIKVPRESILAFCSDPDTNFPYLFPKSFYKLQEICSDFDIDIPPLPPKNNHAKRCEYYRDLSLALKKWRVNEGLSSLEMCVFMYGFAIKYTKSIIAGQRGRTKRVYLLIASPEDQSLFESENYSANMRWAWQGREEMRPGDIALMWERKPKSRMTSVWDILSPGFDDPFSFYSGKVFVGNCRRIPEISFKELAANSIWQDNSLIASNMQGGNGRAIPAECYAAIKQIVAEKDPAFVCSALPPTPEYIDFVAMGMEDEHDVEVCLCVLAANILCVDRH